MLYFRCYSAMKQHLALLVILLSTHFFAQQTAVKKETKLVSTRLDTLQTAYFASGCFWCVEAIFQSVEGVHEVVSGYAGGKEKNPTYASVSMGQTGHAETVKIYYDSSKGNYVTLVDVFFDSHDPTTKNQQGADRGTQYRSAIFYMNANEQKIAKEKITSLLSAGIFPKITTEVSAFESFYLAEDYHQDYEMRNPTNGYVKNVSIPRLNAFKKKRPEVLKKD